MKTSRLSSSRCGQAGAFSAGIIFAMAALSPAATMMFNINANGFNEVNAGGTPNQGDPDAFAIGTITLDNGTGSGTTGSATLTLSIANIDGTLTGHHIHQAPATTTGGIVLDFGNPNTILTGSATSGTLSGTITGLSAATVSSVFANPTGFYYNLHSTSFPGGAVRNQIPEPGTVAVLAMGVCTTLLRRRKRR